MPASKKQAFAAVFDDDELLMTRKFKTVIKKFGQISRPLILILGLTAPKDFHADIDNLWFNESNLPIIVIVEMGGAGGC
jgi:hypothetical protein